MSVARASAGHAGAVCPGPSGRHVSRSRRACTSAAWRSTVFPGPGRGGWRAHGDGGRGLVADWGMDAAAAGRCCSLGRWGMGLGRGGAAGRTMWPASSPCGPDSAGRDQPGMPGAGMRWGGIGCWQAGAAEPWPPARRGSVAAVSWPPRGAARGPGGPGGWLKPGTCSTSRPRPWSAGAVAFPGKSDWGPFRADAEVRIRRWDTSRPVNAPALCTWPGLAAGLGMGFGWEKYQAQAGPGPVDGDAVARLQSRPQGNDRPDPDRSGKPGRAVRTRT